MSPNGALLEWVDCLRSLRGNGHVLVPGGGHFAEQVRIAQRRWHFSDATSHHMAVLAMQQYALLLADLLPGSVLADGLEALREQSGQKPLVICRGHGLFPQAVDGKTGWGLSSDSLGLWLAQKLGARQYLLLKSVSFGGQGLYWPPEPPDIAPGVVDEHFAELRRGFPGEVLLFGPGEADAFLSCLTQGPQ